MANQAQKLSISLDESVTTLTQLCKAGADDLRLRILKVLQGDSFGVLELCQILDIAQPKLSHHLKVLTSAELLATRRDGNSIFYRRSLLDDSDPLAVIKQALFDYLDQLPLDAKIERHIKRIKGQRANSSLDFFTKNADRFKENQDLIAENSQYAANLLDLIKLCDLPSKATAIEIGPGIGDFLPNLAKTFAHVIAVDNSEAMLSQAQSHPQLSRRKNIEWLLGDQAQAVSQGLQGELIVCNMVLHHSPSPADMFKDFSQLLKPGGHVLISELCHHDQEWVRGACGDLWLGFTPEELNDWAQSAGLRSEQSLFLGLRNGFQIQLHLYAVQNESQSSADVCA